MKFPTSLPKTKVQYGRKENKLPEDFLI